MKRANGNWEAGRVCFALFGIGYLGLVANFFLLGKDAPSSEAALATKLAPQVAKTTTLDLPPGEGNPRNSEGAFIKLETGEILYVYTHYDGDSSDDHASAHLASRVSKDGGRTWSDKDEIVLENEGKLNVMSVSLARLRDRSLMLVYLVKEDPGDCRPYVRFSFDEARTWSERVECVREKSYNVVNNDRIAQLADGRLIIPVARHAYKGGDVYNFEAKASVFCLISDDGGRNWTQSESVPNANDIMYQEPGVVELADGRLLMTIRNASGAQYFAYSTDRGASWSDSSPSPLVSPASPAVIKREPGSDNLIAVWNDSPDARNPLSIAILSPDGEEILTQKTLDKAGEGESRGFCYPALCFVDPETFLVGYCCGGGYWGLTASRVSLVRFDDLKK